MASYDTMRRKTVKGQTTWVTNTPAQQARVDAAYERRNARAASKEARDNAKRDVALQRGIARLQSSDRNTVVKEGLRQRLLTRADAKNIQSADSARQLIANRGMQRFTDLLPGKDSATRALARQLGLTPTGSVVRASEAVSSGRAAAPFLASVRAAGPMRTGGGAQGLISVKASAGAGAGGSGGDSGK